MIYETVKKARHVHEFYTYKEKPVDKEVLKDLLEKTYEITPSKNNMAAWQVHVLGPEHQKYKDALFEGSAANDTLSNIGNKDYVDIGHENEKKGIPRENVMYRSLNTAPYVLIVTQRKSELTSPYQKDAWSRGIFYDPCTEKGLADSRENICVECGLFAMNFRALAIEKGIDTTYTCNFNKQLDTKVWKQLPFVDRRVNVMISVGYGKKYRRDIHPITYDYKPSINKIIKWLPA
jgi:nitroreductase|tara:strand:- start:2933 stop:3634 length:702 start_codon:yes stop_codon:yes gene_type:complete